jgi:hypothetical protein
MYILLYETPPIAMNLAVTIVGLVYTKYVRWVRGWTRMAPASSGG